MYLEKKENNNNRNISKYIKNKWNYFKNRVYIAYHKHWKILFLIILFYFILVGLKTQNLNNIIQSGGDDKNLLKQTLDSLSSKEFQEQLSKQIDSSITTKDSNLKKYVSSITKNEKTTTPPNLLKFLGETTTSKKENPIRELTTYIPGYQQKKASKIAIKALMSPFETTSTALWFILTNIITIIVIIVILILITSFPVIIYAFVLFSIIEFGVEYIKKI
jgi:hypothetical protein